MAAPHVMKVDLVRICPASLATHHANVESWRWLLRRSASPGHERVKSERRIARLCVAANCLPDRQRTGPDGLARYEAALLFARVEGVAELRCQEAAFARAFHPPATALPR